jgi:hypothetical protein
VAKISQKQDFAFVGVPFEKKPFHAVVGSFDPQHMRQQHAKSAYQK